MNNLFTAKEACEYLTVRRTKFDSLKLPRVKFGGIIRYRREDLDRFIASKVIECAKVEDKPHGKWRFA